MIQKFTDQDQDQWEEVSKVLFKPQTSYRTHSPSNHGEMEATLTKGHWREHWCISFICYINMPPFPLNAQGGTLPTKTILQSHKREVEERFEAESLWSTQTPPCLLPYTEWREKIQWEFKASDVIDFHWDLQQPSHRHSFLK